MPAPDPPPQVTDAIAPSRGDEALRRELIAALDHDLRTSLTTVLGALQTLARPELAPTDPDLAQLVFSGLAQAQRLSRLLDELPGAASPGDGGPLSPAELTFLIRAAARSGGEGEVRAEVPGDLPPVSLSAPALRRALAGILARGRGGDAARVVVAADGPGCRITVIPGSEEAPLAPRSVERLVATMGGHLEAAGAGEPGLCLVFPAGGDEFAG